MTVRRFIYDVIGQWPELTWKWRELCDRELCVSYVIFQLSITNGSGAIARKPSEGGTRPHRPVEVGFVGNSAKTASLSAAVFLVHLFPHPLGTLCEHFSPRSFKVRSLGKAKWPHVPQRSNLPPNYSTWWFQIFKSGHGLDMRSHFKVDLSWCNYTSLDAAQQENDYGVIIIVLSLGSLKSLHKKKIRTIFTI